MRRKQALSRTAIAAFSLGFTSLHAAEIWSCDYLAPGSHAKQSSMFHVDGSRLSLADQDVIVDFQIVENSNAAIVAVRGGSYASEPTVMSFVVMIKKDTGEFVYSMASIGSANDRTTGLCRRTRS